MDFIIQKKATVDAALIKPLYSEAFRDFCKDNDIPDESIVEVKTYAPGVGGVVFCVKMREWRKLMQAYEDTL